MEPQLPASGVKITFVYQGPSIALSLSARLLRVANTTTECGLYLLIPIFRLGILGLLQMIT